MNLLRLRRFAAIAYCCLPLTVPLVAQEVSGPALQQMRDLYQVKRSFTTAQRKESFDLVAAGMNARNQRMTGVSASMFNHRYIQGNLAAVNLKVSSVDAVSKAITSLGGQVLFSSAVDGKIHARVPVMNLDALAGNTAVRSIRPESGRRTNVGAVTSQGYVTHTANQAVGLGFNGTGVKVGVLSDSASPARVAALIASGDLPADVVVLPGQDGVQQGAEDEGTAMMEIVHDLAPGAKLFFASAFNGEDEFAANIRALRFTYHCDIIVDDVTYFDEGVFQDGTIASAVNDVVANGGLYFSAAQNSGNLTSGTSGTWEGDFKANGDAGSLIDLFEGTAVTVHNFGTVASPQNYDVVANAEYIILQWSDPLGASSNDYDLFILDSTGTTIKGFSADAETGTQDPLEIISEGDNCGTAAADGYCPAPGDRIVVVKYAGAARALHIDTERGYLSIATDGATFGHNAGLNTVSMAATAWNSAHMGTHAFTGAANPVETFSSDGPRKIFYTPGGVPIKAGNFLFATNGGTTLQKPDATAADGVFCHTPGFLPFFGTSAAAPHAAALAALVKSANPALTNIQIKNILTSTALDNMAPGVDRDSGHGVLMAIPAVNAALSAH